jgi:hypothetical protein
MKKILLLILFAVLIGGLVPTAQGQACFSNPSKSICTSMSLGGCSFGGQPGKCQTTAGVCGCLLSPATTVFVSPTVGSITAGGQTQQFTAAVSDNAAVTWSISPAVGNISSTGLYTAPNLISAAQVVTVTATSIVNVTISGSATLVLTPPVAPVITQSGFRNIYGCQSPQDWYFNAPVDKLPIDLMSNSMIAAIASIRLGAEPEFIANQVTNATPTVPSYQMIIGENNGESDSGNFPIGQQTLVGYYTFGLTPSIAAAPAGGWGVNQDDHVTVINSDTCNDYEIWWMQSNTPPYKVGSTAIYNLGTDYKLRTAVKVSQDTGGMIDGADAAGVPVAPMLLTHADAFSGNGFSGMTRFTLDNSIGQFGWRWPSTHSGRVSGSSGIVEGTIFRLRADFDIVTCQQNDNKGKAYPAYFVADLKSLQHRGLMYADGGGNGLLSADADQAWGDPSLSTSDIWAFNAWMHCIPGSALEVVDPQAEIVSIFSGQVNLNPIPR